VWTKSADEILASMARFAQRTLDFHTAQAAPLIARTTRSGHSRSRTRCAGSVTHSRHGAGRTPVAR
jgi:hypothetical protein